MLTLIVGKSRRITVFVTNLVEMSAALSSVLVFVLRTIFNRTHSSRQNCLICNVTFCLR